MKWIKRMLLVLVVGFVLFYLVNQPQGAADAVRGPRPPWAPPQLPDHVLQRPRRLSPCPDR